MNLPRPTPSFPIPFSPDSKRLPPMHHRLATAVLAVLAASILPCGAAHGQTTNLPHTFQPNTPARASEVNENFETLRDGVDQNAANLNNIATAVQANTDAIATLPGAAQNVLTVSARGAQFTSVADALDSITDAASDNRYLVLVYPGTYTETRNLTVPAFVHLMGSGARTSIVEGRFSSNVPNNVAAVLSLSSSATVSRLGVVNRGTGNGIAIGLQVLVGDRTARIEDAAVSALGTGVGNLAIDIRDGDATVLRTEATAAGASVTNAAVSIVDGSGPFAAPLLEDCKLTGTGPNSGQGISSVNGVATVRRSEIHGDFRAVQALVNGATRISGSKLSTSNLNPCYENSGSASILTAGSEFQGGNNTGITANMIFIHCFKSNFSAVTDGAGSTVQ